MNIPNRLTILRVLLVPLFLAVFLISSIPGHYLVAALIFVAASATDWLDGHLARKNHDVTTFGKFLDPLADKVLVISALVALCARGFAGPIPVILIIARDFLVSAIRMMAAAENGQVIAANGWGKVKTVLQMVVITAVLLLCHGMGTIFSERQVVIFSGISVWVLAAFTVLSGAVYLVQNRNLINGYK